MRQQWVIIQVTGDVIARSFRAVLDVLTRCAAQDDASGRQQWVFTPVAGGYTITMPMGRAACGQALTTVACTSSTPNLVSMGTISGSPTSQQVWSLQSVTTPPAPVTQVLSNGNYYIQSLGRPTCANFTSASTTCTQAGANNGVALAGFTGSAQQIWTFTNVGGTNLYNIQCSGRAQCFNFLSAPSCPSNFVDMFAVVSTFLCLIPHSSLSPGVCFPTRESRIAAASKFLLDSRVPKNLSRL